MIKTNISWGGLLLVPALSIFSSAGTAQSAGDFGVTGLIDMPSARMQPDGTFSATYARQDVTDTFALTYQATPWLEGSFRYHILSPREDRVFHYDRSYEIKARLWEEGDWQPEVSVGIRDLLGTGIYAGEYVVGSKGFGSLDMSLGIGWGRLADRSLGNNPLAHLASNFESRSPFEGLGGELRWGDYFAGPKVGLFGGLHYELPEWKVSLLAEYNPDRYLWERGRNPDVIDLNSAWSFGLNWEPVEDVILGVSWQHGSELGLRLTSRLDGKTLPPRENRTLSASLVGEISTNFAEQPAPDWYNRLVIDAGNAGLRLLGASDLGDDQIILLYENYYYQIQTDAAERLFMLAEMHLPSHFRSIMLVYSNTGMQPFSIRYLRRDWDSIYDIAAGADQIRNAMTFLPAPDNWQPDIRTRTSPRVHVTADLKPRLSLFDPDDPARYQIYMGVNAYAPLGNGWAVQGGVDIDIDNNFDEITREANSVLPHVRSDMARYLKEGPSAIQYLFVDKHGQWGPELYYRGFGGYLEEMYAGVGLELLYRPFRSRWAFGFNLIGVKQRDYDKRFDFLDYQTTIGHLSLYWASPYCNYDAALHVGRYLAGDWGQTLEIKRRFANGWEVGAFATFTDVSAEDFGEGSFDKGITIRIPLAVLTGGGGRATAIDTTIRPLTRDGGQRLDAYGTSLWDTLRSSTYDELTLPERTLP